MEEPQSARDLQRAIDALNLHGRRANPGGLPDDVPPEDDYAVQVKFREGGSPWIRHDLFGSPEAAREEVVAMVDPRSGERYEVGTAVRILHRRESVWIGVVAGAGEAVEAPPIPKTAPPKAPRVPANWMDAWEGRTARANWMLYQCADVEPRLVVAAAAALLRRAMPSVTGGRQTAEFALDAVERWARGESRVEEMQRDVVRGASSLAEEFGETYPMARLIPTVASMSMASDKNSRRRMAHDAGSVAHDAAMIIQGPLAPVGRRYAEMTRMSETVREFIPLGVVLFARLSERAKGANPTRALGASAATGAARRRPRGRGRAAAAG